MVFVATVWSLTDRIWLKSSNEKGWLLYYVSSLPVCAKELQIQILHRTDPFKFSVVTNYNPSNCLVHDVHPFLLLKTVDSCLFFFLSRSDKTFDRIHILAFAYISKSCELQVSSVAAWVCIGLHSWYTLSSVGFRCLYRPVQPTAAKNEVCWCSVGGDSWDRGQGEKWSG